MKSELSLPESFFLSAASTNVPKANARAIPVADPEPNSGTLWGTVELIVVEAPEAVLVEVVELVFVSVCALRVEETV